jgi:glycosyltransferase involved in cell wall biosynthesis
VEGAAARALAASQRGRLTVERVLSDLAGTRRVAATACWQFPIYSQTFVYQELTQLARRGFRVRFFYGGLDRGVTLADQFGPVWRGRRRAVLHPAVGAAALRHFSRHHPERLARLLERLEAASGLSRADLLADRHVAQAFAFARLVQAYRPHYLHTYFFYEGTLFGLVASELLQVPRGVSCYADHMLDDWHLKVVPLHLRQCSTVVATSRRIRDELLAIEPSLPADRILVKPNGINVEAFPVVARPSRPTGTPLRLVSVCRIEPKKGLLELVDAVAMLRDRGHDVRLEVIGAPDETAASRHYARALAERIAARQVSQAITLAGRRSEREINAAFRSAHLFVAPFVETESGDKDGVPTSLLEAMAAGMPVVASDAGSIPEVIEDGRHGVVVPQRSPDALADAIEALADDPARREVLGIAAAARAREAFDANHGEQSLHDRVEAVIAAAARSSGELAPSRR